MHILSRVRVQESWYKVAVSIYIITCSPAGKLISSCNIYILPRVHLQKSSYKVAVCIYYHVFVWRKVDIKLRYVYIITCSSAGKLIKVVACLYHHVFTCMNVNIKLRSVYIFTCSSTRKLTQSCGMYILSRVHL